MDGEPSFSNGARWPLSIRVADVLRAGRPPSRGPSSVNRLAPNAKTAPPRRLPPRNSFRARRRVCGDVSAAAVLAPPVDELIIITHGEAPRGEEKEKEGEKQHREEREEKDCVHVSTTASLGVSDDVVCAVQPSQSGSAVLCGREETAEEEENKIKEKRKEEEKRREVLTMQSGKRYNNAHVVDAVPPASVLLAPQLHACGNEDVTELLIVARDSTGSNNNNNNNNNSRGSNKLSSGPLVVRVFVPRVSLDEANVTDLKVEVERQLGVPVERQVLRADGVVLRDDLPLSLLDTSAVLFMNVEPSLYEKNKEHEYYNYNNNNNYNIREITSAVQERETTSQYSDALLERMERLIESKRIEKSGGKTHAVYCDDGGSLDECTALNYTNINNNNNNINNNNNNKEREESDDESAAYSNMSNGSNNNNYNYYNYNYCKNISISPSPQPVRTFNTHPPLDVLSPIIKRAAGTSVSVSPAGEKVSARQRELLEDAMARARRQVELLAWLCRRSGQLCSSTSSNNINNININNNNNNNSSSDSPPLCYSGGENKDVLHR